MEQYISKSTLVAAIERRRDMITQGISCIPLTGRDRADATFEYEILGTIKDFIDILKIKESEEEKVPTWKKVGPDVGQTTLYMNGAKSYLERFGYRISLNELDKLPKEENL